MLTPRPARFARLAFSASFVLWALSSLAGCAAAPAVTTPAGPAITEPPAAGNAAAGQTVPGPAMPAPETAAATAPATPIADAYRDVAGRILQAALADHEDSYAKLAYLTDRIGHRLSGSVGLERAVAWAARVMQEEGHENVRADKVMVPHWVRGKESAALLAPVERPLHVLGLGNTVGTGPRGVTAEVVVADSFEQLEAMGRDAVAGKIVLYNKAMPHYHPDTGSGYGEVSAYRMNGPSRAARLGARAVLLRSVTARSLRSPHTGTLIYEDDTPRIPAAAITTEDADLIARLAAAGTAPRVQLTLGARMLPDAASANVLAELRGSERPDEVIVIGAHLDSWDVGQGAHDDGAGCITMMHALTLLRRLDLRPRRTIRVVLFTNEENGIRGARAYARDHGAEDHVMALESDSGAFAPLGFRVQAGDPALAQMRDIVTLLAPIDATWAEQGFSGVDIMPLAQAGVPTLGLEVDGATYFDYHHTHADTLDKVDPAQLARNVAAVAVVAYVIADMPARFGGPRAAAPHDAAASAH